MIKHKKNKGFSLIELALVIFIISILLGYTVALLPIQRELSQYRTANSEMDAIIDAIYAYAQVNDRLPCPDGNGDGTSDATIPPSGVVTCTSYVGFLPAKTLGIDGKYNTAGALLDPWDNSYRYYVSQADRDNNGVVDFVNANGITFANISTSSTADLQICNVSQAPSASSCNGMAETISTNVPAVVLSLGKDGDSSTSTSTTSSNQIENNDDDILFVKTTRNDTTAGKYDDVIRWISANTLYSKMIAAGRLP